MNRALFAVCVGGVLGMGFVTAAHAQSPWSADLSWGLANVTGGSYTDRRTTGFAGRVGYRLIGGAGTDLVLGGTIEQLRGTHPLYVTVAPCPSPGCSFAAVPPGVPNFTYEALTLGVRQELEDATFAVDGGLGSVQVQNTGRRLGVSGGAELAFHMTLHVAAVLRGEILSWTEGGNTLHAYPVTFGLRVH